MSMGRWRCLGLFVHAALAASCASFWQRELEVRTGNFTSIMLEGDFERATLRLVRDQARLDLDCPGIIDVDLRAHGNQEVIRASGCDRGAVYARLVCGNHRAFVPVSLMSKDRTEGVDPFSQSTCERDVWALVELNERGSNDLHCPRGEVLPASTFSAEWIADGCGLRASYRRGLAGIELWNVSPQPID
jgi:hypothetical protein